MTGQRELFGGPPRDASASQWFTAPWIVDEIGRRWSSFFESSFVLEPAAGDGRLVAEALDHGASHVVAIERNTALAAGMRARFAEDERVTVFGLDALDPETMRLACSALPARDRAADEVAFDVVVMNPPFENGGTCDFLELALTHAESAFAVLPAAAIHGRDRHDRIWSKHTLSEWLPFITRPRFDGAMSAHKRTGRPRSQSPARDFALYHVSRHKRCFTTPVVDWIECPR